MTQNQIRYEELKEAQRSNLANENLKREANALTRAGLEEEKRRNTLNYNASVYASGASYQQAQAALAQANVAARNAETNALNAQTAQGKAITERSAYEENVRHNVEVEKTTKTSNVLNFISNIFGVGARLASGLVG